MSKYQYLYLELELWTLTTGGKQLQLQLGKPIDIENNKRQEEQQNNEPMVFISFAYWTRVKLLFVNIKPILKGLTDDSSESTGLFLKLK